MSRTPRLVICLPFLTVCAAAQTGTLNTLVDFPIDDGQPEVGVIIGPGGVLYGTNWRGGDVYSLTPPSSGRGWAYGNLYTFPTIWVGSAGYSVSPNNLAMDRNGVLYATNFSGGILTGPCAHPLVGCGSVYSLTPPAPSGGSWTFTDIYEFTGGDDGAEPGGGVVIGSGGVLYGTTDVKGSAGLGTVYAMTPPASAGGAWTQVTIHTFTGPPDGSLPEGTLTIASNGVLYGTTCNGGTAQRGTVFSLTPPTSPGGEWSETVLYSFIGGTGGSVPNGGVLLGPGDVLYGSTRYGGASNGGVVYQLTPPAQSGGSWTETVLHSFHLVGKFGIAPGPLVLGPNAALYGVTQRGGTYYQGSVFALTPPASAGSAWNFLTIYSFDAPGGNSPYSGYWTPPEALAVGAGGLLYGTTYFGGTTDDGIVFSLHP